MADPDNADHPRDGTEKSPSPSDFGKVLRAAREEKGLTLSGLAERSGVAIRTITACERGETASPRPKIVARLALALDADPKNWLELAGRQLPREAIERLAAEIPSVTEPRGQGGSPAQGLRVGEDAVLDLLKEVSERDRCNDLVIHIHSAIGFYTGKYHSVAEAIRSSMKKGIRILYVISERWGAWPNFEAKRVHKELRKALKDNEHSKQLFVAIEPPTGRPPSMPSLFLRVAGVSKLRSAASGALDARMLEQSDLTKCWVEVTNDLSAGFDLAKSTWVVVPNVDQYQASFEDKWQQLQAAGIPIKPLFDEEHDDEE